MKKALLLALISFTSNQVISQVINIQVGTAISKLDWTVEDVPGQPSLNGVDESAYSEPIQGLSVYIGIDYFDHKYYNLSTNIGYIQKGGQYTVDYVLYTSVKKAQLHYLSLNTLLDLKLPVTESISPFLSLGPRIDFLSSHEGEIIENLSGKNTGELDKLMYGCLLGAGAKYSLQKIQFGVRFDYYFNFTHIANYEWKRKQATYAYGNGTLKDHTYSINLVVGYKL
ncbi:outer membrane beta-barrel protein [Owenweeksia hongkongensis]|uniref:outer membrane beta-barrel protein n=1 Tax=Owenweeksia hongkongensis TaxID=253245 RepID=UPI003A900F77